MDFYTGLAVVFLLWIYAYAYFYEEIQAAWQSLKR